MAVSRRAVVALALAGVASTRTATLSAFPKYCAKEMDATSIPPLNDSVAASFGGQVSLADVEILQVGGGCFYSVGVFRQVLCISNAGLPWCIELNAGELVPIIDECRCRCRTSLHSYSACKPRTLGSKSVLE